MEITSEKPPLTVKLFEKGQLVPETEIKYKLYFRTYPLHLPLPKANGRGCGRLRENSWLPEQPSVRPQGRMEMPGPRRQARPGPRPIGQACSGNCLHTDQGRDKHLPSSCTCSKEYWPCGWALPDSRHQPENRKEYHKVTKYSESNLSISLSATPQELALE